MIQLDPWLFSILTQTFRFTGIFHRCLRVRHPRSIRRTEGLRSGTRVRPGPVQIWVLRKRPAYLRRQEPTRIQRRTRLRQGILQLARSRWFHPCGRVHRRWSQRIQRWGQENRRTRIQSLVQRTSLQSRLPCLPCPSLRSSGLQTILICFIPYPLTIHHSSALAVSPERETHLFNSTGFPTF
jgi:hypothetical protein